VSMSGTVTQTTLFDGLDFGSVTTEAVAHDAALDSLIKLIIERHRHSQQL
jgi:hypothetical protein